MQIATRSELTMLVERKELNHNNRAGKTDGTEAAEPHLVKKEQKRTAPNFSDSTHSKMYLKKKRRGKTALHAT